MKTGKNLNVVPIFEVSNISNRMRQMSPFWKHLRERRKSKSKIKNFDPDPPPLISLEADFEVEVSNNEIERRFSSWATLIGLISA